MAKKAAKKAVQKSSKKPATQKMTKPTAKQRVKPLVKMDKQPKQPAEKQPIAKKSNAKIPIAQTPTVEKVEKFEKTTAKPILSNSVPATVPPQKTKKSSSVEAKGEQTDPIWSEYFSKHGSDKAQSYDMKSQFEAHKPLQHKVFGWGWIVSNENDRLEVIFKDGKRTLISNYKSR